jgi:DNA repair helicase Rad3
LAEIPWSNAVIIFDEAHNLESFASESVSFDLSSKDLTGCMNEIDKAIRYIQNISQDSACNLKLENLIIMKSIFQRLQTKILDIDDTSVYSGEFMMDLFKSASLTHATHEVFIEEARRINDFIMDNRGTQAVGASKLEHFVSCLKRVYGYSLESRCLAKAAFYRVHVTPKNASATRKPLGRFQKNTTPVERVVSYWCFAPSVAMEELINLNVRSVLVTSGTLSPLPSYAMELGLKFPHTLENPHIIAKEQIHVRVIGKGPSGKVLTSSFERRNDDEYYSELGNTLVSLAKVVPDGMLVFFPSYIVMETCIERWGGPSIKPKNSKDKSNFFAPRKKNTTEQYAFPVVASLFGAQGQGSINPWKRLLSVKSVVVEPRSAVNLQDAFSEFRRFLALPKSPGCVMMGVCRGKISEGIDFSHEMSRAVVITGLPFPPALDPKVKLKREYLDHARARANLRPSRDAGFIVPESTRKDNVKLSGNEWYTQQAHRAVNQAIGRVIRNISDYGAVLLLDSRFGLAQNQQGLSKWLRAHVLKDQGFGITVRELASFYRSAVAVANEQKRANENNGVQLQYDQEQLLCSVNADSRDVVATSSLVTKPLATASDQTTESKLSSKATESMSIAVQFMKMVHGRMGAAEQSLVKKSVIAMKRYGELKALQAYFSTANDIVRQILACEKFDSLSIEGGSTKMLFLFFRLLPTSHRAHVQQLAFEIVVETSSIGIACKESMDSSQAGAWRSSLSSLVVSTWCPGVDSAPLTLEQFLTKLQPITEGLLKHSQLKSSEMTRMLSKLLPTRFSTALVALSDESGSGQRMQKMKGIERLIVGEASLDESGFVCQAQKREASTSVDTASMQAVDENGCPSVDVAPLVRVPQPPVPSRVDETRQINPYSKRAKISAALAVVPGSLPKDWSKSECDPAIEHPSHPVFIQQDPTGSAKGVSTVPKARGPHYNYDWQV